jgi:MFS transporter, ACS family, hexuronate transporter
MLYFVTTNNYMDRQVLGVMAPELIRLFGWAPEVYTDIALWFQVAYALGFIAAGRWFDLVGTRLGFAGAVACWSLAAVWHGAVGTVAGFKIVRFLLGLTEPSHMPGGIKVVAEWFPPSERALATGIFKSGSNLGGIVVPVLVPWLFFSFGWRATFCIIGATGFIWLFFWIWLYRPVAENRRVTPEERAYIQQDQAPVVGRRVPWRTLLRRRETWAYVNFKFMTDAVWHWYLAMLPLFLSQKFGLGLREFGLPLVAVYLIAGAGSIGGGWLSSHWIKRGWDLTRARHLSMFICCACTLPVMLVVPLQNLWIVIALVGLAHAAHQGLTSNLFSAVSDLFPRQAVASVVGFGGTAGQVGAALMTLASGIALAETGSLTVMFFIAGSTYLVAFLVFYLLVPRLAQVDFGGRPP